MRQSLSLSRPAVVKLLRVSERTLHNWETGKVRIPYAAYKLVRLFNSYEIFHPIWRDWKIVGSRLITPEGHSLDAGNFHWLSLMARRSDAFGRLNREIGAQIKAEDDPSRRATVR
jgi:DNA-binding XRE family transcriptional regulator